MKRKKKVIKPSEARMLQTLWKVPRSLTTNELASKSHLSWQTTDKYLKKWRGKGLIKATKIPLLKRNSIKKTWALDKKKLRRLLTK